MVDFIKPSELPAASTVYDDDAIVVDNAGLVQKATPEQVVNAGAPVASQAEAIAGSDNTKRMTALRVRQVLDDETAPSVLRAQAWAEASGEPDPAIPGSKSAKTWAEEAELARDETVNAAPFAVKDAAAFFAKTDLVMGARYWSKDGLAWDIVPAGSGDFDHPVAGVGVIASTLSGNYYAEQFPALATAFEVAARAKIPLTLTGSYTADAPLLNIYSGDAELHLRCVGDVVIEVDHDADYIRDLIICQTDSISSGSVSGGSLTINGNEKIGSGITWRHLASEDGGEVMIDCPVRVTGCKKEAAGSYENGGILIFGRYTRIVLRQPEVSGVTRLSSDGACDGICCSGFVGDVDIYSPKVSRVFIGSGTTDADGIKVFGRDIGGGKHAGRVRVYSPKLTDCQGRSYKSQCSDDVVYDPVVVRDAAVAVGITNGVDFDFQCGNGRVVNPRLIYRKDNSTSPLGTSHSIVAFQSTIESEPQRSRLENATILSDVAVPRIVLAVHTTNSADSVTEVDGIDLLPTGGLTTTMVGRAIVEMNMTPLLTRSGKTHINIIGVRGPAHAPLLGYTGYDGSTDMSDKLSLCADDCRNSIAPTSNVARALHNLSGAAIQKLPKFAASRLSGYRTLYAGAFEVNFAAVEAGQQIIVDLSTVVATNPPSWGSSGYALIEGFGSYWSGTDRTVRVTKFSAAPNCWVTTNGGTNWHVVSAAS